MDAKITKKRLGRMLSYDWIKIIAVAAALIFGWVLIFTMTATRITSAQQFTVYNYMNNATFTTTGFGNFLDKAKKDGVFSYEILETTTLDLAATPDNATMLLETRIATYEGDVVLVADIGNPALGFKEDEQTGEKIFDYTYTDTFAANYRYTLFDLDKDSPNGYFKQMENFLIEYFGTDWKNGALKKSVVEKNFRNRVEDDKRFKKETQIKAGLKDEEKRLESYRKALVRFYELLEEGIVTFVNTDVQTKDVSVKGTYFINICPTEKTEDLVNITGYYVPYYDDATGKQETKLTAENMCVAFMNIFEDDYDLSAGFQYEDLVFTVYMVDSCLKK